jgi:nuclear pore complex protein Nup205
VDDVEYQINHDFQEGVLNVAEALNLDELRAAKLYLNAQDNAGRMRRPAYFTAITHFHDHRQLVVECLNIIFQQLLNDESPEEMKNSLQEVVQVVFETKDRSASPGSLYVRKCFAALRDIERRMQYLGEQLHKTSLVGGADSPEYVEVIHYQRTSLANQHECLCMIVCHLFKGNYASSEEFRMLLDSIKVLDRFDRILIHYIPALIAAIVQYGSPDSGNHQDARSLHQKITAPPEIEPWNLHSFHAATIVLWLSEYSGWYSDSSANLGLEGVNLDEEAESRSTLFMSALADGGLQFILAVCSSVTSGDWDREWHDPARQELVTLLLADANGLTLEGSRPVNTTTLLMEHFETFAESCIANMPDAVRRLKVEEDQLRLGLLDPRGKTQQPPSQGAREAPMHLEAFLVIIAFAYEHRPEAAEEFWTDPDGNLFGFLHWASKRQTVPRVSAFCEMLCAVSEGEECAGFAHKFLLEEGPTPAKKLKRSSSMSWAQMFAELQLYAARVGERSSASQQSGVAIRKANASQMSEPESPLMLACYLRLIAHMCRESSQARQWLLNHKDFDLRYTLLVLNCASIPAHLRASIFTALEGLMTERTFKIGEEMWLRLDVAFSGSFLLPPSQRLSHATNPPAWSEHVMFEVISNSFEESNSFVSLLQSITCPSADATNLNDALPFPETLGSAYRMPGIEPYVDLVLGQVFAKKLPELQDKSQIWVLRCNCLNFIATCLSTFNENLVVIANQFSDYSIDTSMRASSLKAYVQLHPFSRTMEWLFNENVVNNLLTASHENNVELLHEYSSPTQVQSVLKSIEVMNLVFDMQATYLDIVRPLIKQQLSGRKTAVANPSIVSFEDFVLKYPRIVADLCRYCGTGLQELTLASLSLLKRLSSSRKLNRNPASNLGRSMGPNKIVQMLESEADSDLLARQIVDDMESDVRELESGPDAPGYAIKMGIFEFLNGCLASIPDSPNIAHLFLGFSYIANSLTITAEGQFAAGTSLFHTVLRLVQTYPFGAEGSMLAWTMQIKEAGVRVLKLLWSSPLSSSLAVTELRQYLFLSSQFVAQPLVNPRSLWDGQLMSSEEFLTHDSSNTLARFLRYRAMLFQYAITEMRFSSREGSSSIQAQVLSTLMGNSADVNGETVAHVNLFDLFDFADLDIPQELGMPELSFLDGIDLGFCANDSNESGRSYDVPAVEELIDLKKTELFNLNYIQPSSLEEQRFTEEAQMLLAFVLAVNQLQLIQSARLEALRYWVELVMVVVELGQLDVSSKTTMILQALQVVFPRLEKAIFENVMEATEMARLVTTLMKSLDSDTLSDTSGRAGDVVNDRLFQLFRVCLRGIPAPETPTALRDLFYTISTQYLARMTDEMTTTADLRRQSMQVVKSAGERLIDLVCDDSFAGEQDHKTSALLLLNLLVCLAKQQDSSFVIDAFVRLNYLGMLVDSVKNISAELQDTDAEGEFEIRLCLSDLDS